ncbi:imidazolonepropionase (plasmid) [Halorarum halophilum]|uniref:Imidazolonepropionase n=1 Tax=Halorarum halophilum TaxID=2743090 RepID=A0A7D5GEF6_9EURY|nr:imidazolonepropionase [Halobaculum halophilum]QLG29772.1 imidazolonepropionase [Halobaculum halophilum]
MSDESSSEGHGPTVAADGSGDPDSPGLTVVHGASELVVGPDEGVGVETVADAAFAAEDGQVVAVGETEEVLREYPAENADVAVDADGRLVTPGFVDPHTHAIFAGDRTDEFEAKLGGTSYEDILAAGGGILRTVRAVRAADEATLTANLVEHLDVMLAHGTTTVEVKSGYGLSTDAELKLLRAIAAADEAHPVTVVPTFMGAHAVPEDREVEGYTEEVIEEQLPAVADQGIAEFCDVFCERGVFDAEQSRRILAAGLEASLTPKVHADEFADVGATGVAADVGAASADHLLKTDDEGADRLVDGGVTPVLLPATAFALGEEYADARRFLDGGTPVALATDFNPNCYARSMGFVVTLACVGMRATPDEALRGATHTAARAIDRTDGTGTLRPGAPADAVVHDVTAGVEIPYNLDVNTADRVVVDGEVVHE